MKPAKLFRRWQESKGRLLAALARLPERVRRRGEAEEVHELRVTVRRLRLLIRLGAAWYGEETSSQFRDWSRGISSATDRVRDLDVALEWLVARPQRHRELEAHLERDRRHAWQAARRRIKPLPASLRRQLALPEGGRKHEVRLAKRCGRLVDKLRERCLRDAPRFFRVPLASQHDFRRLVRRWRYLRELELPDNRHRKDDLLQRLLRLQEALGHRQNLLLADEVLDALPPYVVPPALLTSLTAEIRRTETDIRRRRRI